MQRLLLRKRTKGRRRADGSVSVTFARMSSSLVWLKLQVFRERGGGAKNELGERVGKMFSDSRKVPANTGLTNGVHQAGFDVLLMALM